jgi:hypothetical protein
MKKSFKLKLNKSITISTLLLLISVTVFIACKRSLADKMATEEFNVNAAKEWYYGVFKKSNEFKALDLTSPFLSNRGNKSKTRTSSIDSVLKKFPKWNLAKSYEKNGLQIVEMPLLYNETTVLMPGMQNETNETKTKIANASLSKIIFVKKPDNSINVRLITLVPKVAYAQSKNYDISSNSLNRFDTNFSGFVMVRKWDEEIVKVDEVLNGQKVKNVKLVRAEDTTGLGFRKNTNNTNARTVSCDLVWVPKMFRTCIVVGSGDDPDANENCEQWSEPVPSEYYGTWEPVCTDVENDWNPDDLCTLFGIGCVDEGGGGDDDSWLDVSVVDDLSDPCTKNTKNLITDISCGTYLSKLFQSTFSNQGAVYNINFRQDQFRLGPTGDPLDAFSDFSQSTNTFIIYLNTNQIKVYSKEYVGSIILHEIVHAFLSTQNPPIPDLQQHSEMVKSWIKDMSTLLQTTFGISEIDANALAINGTGNAIYGDGVTPPSDWNNFVHNSFGLYPSQVAPIATDYRDKSNGKGTNCN